MRKLVIKVFFARVLQEQLNNIISYNIVTYQLSIRLLLQL